MLKKSTGVPKKPVHILSYILCNVNINIWIFFIRVSKKLPTIQKIVVGVNEFWRLYFKLVTHATAQFEKHPNGRSGDNSEVVAKHHTRFALAVWIARTCWCDAYAHYFLFSHRPHTVIFITLFFSSPTPYGERLYPISVDISNWINFHKIKINF